MSSSCSFGHANKLPFEVPKTSENWNKIYQDGMAKEREIVEAKSWLQNQHPMGNFGKKVDFHLLGVLDGDAYIGETPVEGCAVSESLGYFQGFTEQLLIQAKGNPEKFKFLANHSKTIQHFHDEITDCLQCDAHMNAVAKECKTEEFSSTIEKKAKFLQQHFKQKQVGWMSLLWNTKNGESHAMMLRIDKKAGSVTIVNTGAGIQNHPGIQATSIDPLTGELKEEYKVQQFFKIVDVDKKRLDSLDFFRFLIELQVMCNVEGRLDINEKNVYQTLPGYLKGKVEAAVNPFLHPEAFKKPQRSGTCSIKCVSTMFYYMMSGIIDGDPKSQQEGIDCFRKLRFLWQSYALVDYCKNHLKKAAIMSSNNRGFIKDLMENLSRAADKLHNSNLMTEQELAEMHATFLDIEAKLKRIEKEPAAVEDTKPVSCAIKGLHSSSIDYLEVTPPMQGQEKVMQIDRAASTTHKSPSKKGAVNFHKLKLDQDPVRCEQQLEDARWKLHEAWRDAYDLARNSESGSLEIHAIRKKILDQFSQLVLKLPDPSKKEDSFWNTIPEKDVPSCMETLFALMKKLKDIQMLQGETKHEADITAMLYVLFAINVQLAKRLNKTILDKYTINYFDLLSEMRSPQFLLKSSGLQKKLEAILNYFDPAITLANLVDKQHLDLQKQTEALFSFKHAPQLSSQFTPGKILKTEKVSSENETIRFYKELLNDKAIRDRLYRFGVKPEDSTLDHVCALINNKRRLLPPSINILQNAALLCQFHHYGRVKAEHVGKTLWSSDFEIEASLKDLGQRMIEIKLIPEDTYQFDKVGALRAIQDNHLKQEVSNSSYVLEQAERYQQNELIVSPLGGTELDLGLDSARELNMIGVDPYGTVARALTFFEKRLSLLKKQEMQDLLKVHLFRYGCLLSQLEDQPAIVGRMAAFFKNGLSHYRQVGDLDTCLFLAKLGHDLKVFVTRAGYKDDLPDFRKMLKEELLQQFGGELSNRRAIFETLVSFYENFDEAEILGNKTLLNKAVADFIGCKIIKAMGGSEGRHADTSFIVQKKCGSLIEDAMSMPSCNWNEILNESVKLADPRFQKGMDWKHGQDGIYENDHYSVDLREGRIRDKLKGAIVALPQSIVEDDRFKKIFKGEFKSCTQSALFDTSDQFIGNVYVINEKLPNALVVRTGADGAIAEIERTINGKKYHYSDQADLLADKIPTLFKEKELSIWVSLDEPKELIVQRDSTCVYKAQLIRKKTVFALQNLSKISANGQILEWVRFSRTDATLQADLLKIEENDAYIECWMAKEGQKELAEMRCPRLGLSFMAKNDNRANKRLFCQQYPGYFLVKNPEIPLLKGAIFLTLQNNEGDTKVLFPDGSMDSQFVGGTLTRTLEHRISLNETLTWNEFEYTDGELRSKNNKGRFLIVLFHSILGEYEKAFDVLNTINGLSRFDDTVKHQFFFLPYFLKKDKHPAAQALLMHLIVKLEENHLKYPLPIGAHKEPPRFTFNDLKEAYRDYAINAANAPLYRLSERQEKIFFALLEKELDKGKDQYFNDDPNGFKGFFSAIWGDDHIIDSIAVSRRRYLKEGVAKLGVRRVLSAPEDTVPEKDPTIDTLRNLFVSYGFKKDVKQQSEHLRYLIHDDEFFKTHFAALYNLARSGSEKTRETLKRMLEFNAHLKNPYVHLLKEVSTRPKKYPTFEDMQLEHERVKNARNELSRALDSNDSTEGRLVAMKAKLIAAKKQRDQLYESISSKDINILEAIKILWNKIQELFLGKFSFLSAVIEPFYNIFRKRHFHSADRRSGKRTPINGNGKVLKEADQAFDQYFANLVNKYFVSKEKEIDQYWEKDKVQFSLPKEHDRKDIQAKLQQENTDLAAYRKTLPSKVNIYSLKDGVQIPDLKMELEATAKTLSTQLKTQREAILWQLNRTSKKMPHEIHKRGQNKRLRWDDVRKLTLEGSLEGFQAKTDLTKKECEQIMLGISDILIKSTRLDQIKTVIAAIEKTDKGVLKKEMLIQNVVAALKIVRAYEPDTANMHKQWFEAANHYHYRQEQLDKISTILNVKTPEVLAEMPTGFGKTKTVLPSINIEKAMEGWLVINTWPASLEMTNTLDVKEQMEESFGKKVDRMIFDRSSDFTKESLQFLYEELIKDKKEGRSINSRSETVRSLQLHFLLSLKQANDPKLSQEGRCALKNKIEYFIKILREIRLSGWTSIDEAHVTLDPMDKLIYTLGEPMTLPDEQMEIMQEIFKLLTDEPLASVVKIQDNQQHLLNDEQVDKDVAPKIAEHFRKKLKIADSLKDNYDDFVLGRKGDIPNWIKDHPSKELIALLKGELTQVLKSCLKGSVDENYGLSKLHIKKKEFAISYSNANTPKETETNPSQFKNPHETMNKTYMTYLNKGLKRFQVDKLIELLRKQAEGQSKEGISYENTEANKFFKKILPDEKKLLMSLSDTDIERLSPSISTNREAIFYYIRFVVAPQFKIYPENLVSTVHNFRSQFASSLSLSATPQSPPSHGPDTYFVPMAGTSGQVTHLLLTKCKDPKTLHMVDALKPSATLDKTLNIIEKNPRIHAVMDVGALYKGLSNEEVAMKMREKFEEHADNQAILFFDEKEGLFKVMDVASGCIENPSELQIDPEKSLSFYDQSRCFGSDLKQAVDAVGLLLTGKDTTKASAGQGAGRMRGLKGQQSVEIAYQKEIKEKIFKKDPHIRDLLVYWIVNQVDKEANQNYQSQLQQMENEIQSRLYDKLLGLPLGSDEPAILRALEQLGEKAVR